MMRTSSWLFFAFLLFPGVVAAQGIIINEVYNSGATDEWIELLVVRDSVDVRGWSLRDFSSSGGPQPALNFTTNSLWNSLRRGTIIIVARPENVFPEDADPSDNLLVIKANNAAYFWGGVFSLAGSSDAIELRDASALHVIGVSWGAANAASLPQPTVHFDAILTSGTTVSFLEDSTPEAVVTTAWAFNAPSVTRGAGNGGNNSVWVTSLRASADGSGTATVQPDTLQSGETVTLAVTYRKDPAFPITDLRVILPDNFLWPQSTAAVIATGFSATAIVSGDTILFNGLSMAADSAVVFIEGLTSPDSTAIYPIIVETKSIREFRPVGPLPRVVVFGLPEAIAAVKENDPNGIPRRVNSLVTVQGIVTVANQFGGPSYLQDNSGGLAVFGSTFSAAVNVGDEVVVSGVLQPFGGLSEIVTPVLHSVLSSGVTVDPLPVTVAQIRDDGKGGVETLEGCLVRVNNVTVSGSGTWLPNTNYQLIQGRDTTQLRIDNSTPLVGLPVPASSVDIVGVVGQYLGAPPYVGGYQLMPRYTGDIISGGPVFATFPVEIEITPTSITVGWKTVHPGSSFVRYGATPALELGITGVDSMSTSHQVPVAGLRPAAIYYLQAFSVAGADTSTASALIASTSSPAASTGTINVYFNASVNTSVAWPTPASGNQNLVNRLLARLSSARRSIDAAFYNLSGTPGPGTDIATALVSARSRGVRVRVICENDNSTNSPFKNLVSNGIPVLNDAADPVLRGAGLMHNKFVVIDGRGGAPESTWVWTGSWNPTQAGTFNDYQNSIEIQDAALAVTYTKEFEEMWGTSADAPNLATVRFGSRKTDNTPHRFVIGGRDITCYFSPSDRTTSRIITTLNGARHSIAFSLLTMTRPDISAALVAKRSAGATVRGVLDNNSDTGSQYSALIGGNVDVLLKSGTGSGSYLLHHKYGLVDAEDPTWNPAVITGSHNWTNSAENSNDENTLIVRDATIANHYLQEFTARYYQYGGLDSIRVDVADGSCDVPSCLALFQNFPNPFNPKTVVSYQVSVASRVRLTVYDVLGRDVATLVNEVKQPGTYTVGFDGTNLASGVYLYRLETSGGTLTRRMLLLK